MASTGLKRDIADVAMSGHAAVAPFFSPKRARGSTSSDCGASQQAMVQVDARDFECSICLSLMVDPVVAACGHDFCKSCLDEWRETTSCAGSKGVSCPVCRQIVMAPGVQTIGVCVRLQKIIEQVCPRQVQERRLEIQAQAAEKACIKQRQAQEQIALVQSIMRARFSRVAQLMQPNSELQQHAHSRSSSSPGSNAAAASAPAQSSQAQLPGGVWACTRTHAAQANPSSSTSTPAHPTWHCPERDAPLRQTMLHVLLQLLSRRRPEVTQSFQQRLPSLLVKLEEVLYRTAASREQYADQAMLESRVQLVVRQLTQRQSPRAGSAPAEHSDSPVSPVVAMGVPVHALLPGSLAI